MAREGEVALNDIKAFHTGLLRETPLPAQLPEPNVVLGLEQRKGQPVRVFKHIHQSCVMSLANYAFGTRIKLLSLCDAFLLVARARNPVGMYSVARSALELAAVQFDVRSRLLGAATHVTVANWQPGGEEFFGVLIRARYGTTRPDLRDFMAAQGLSPARLKPFNVTASLQNLVVAEGFADAVERYAHLCDYVHHNLSSNTLGNSGSGTAGAARSASGGVILSVDGGDQTITEYNYPIAGAKRAGVLDELAPRFLHDVRAALRFTFSMPESPFSPELRIQVTGSRDAGMVFFPNAPTGRKPRTGAK